MSINKALAARAFEAIAHANHADLDRISASVEMEIYQCPSVEYQRWLDAFRDMASLWAIEHWRLLARLFAAHSTYHEIHNDDPERADKYAKFVDVCHARSAALEIALDRVCAAHGLSPDAVRAIAGTEEETAVWSSAPPDLDYLRDIMSDMERVINRSPTASVEH